MPRVQLLIMHAKFLFIINFLLNFIELYPSFFVAFFLFSYSTIYIDSCSFKKFLVLGKWYPVKNSHVLGRSVFGSFGFFLFLTDSRIPFVVLPVVQAVPLSARKATGGSAEGIAPFLQLPHFSEAVIKKIARKVSG